MAPFCCICIDENAQADAQALVELSQVLETGVG